MKNKPKSQIIDRILWILSLIIVPIIAIIWVGGILAQWIIGVQSQDLSFFLTYGQITLTLFGFTMISAIFEKNIKKPIVNDLFRLSIVFLSSSISFFFLYSSSFLFFQDQTNTLLNDIYAKLLVFSLIVALLGLVYGILSLLQILLKHARENSNNKT